MNETIQKLRDYASLKNDWYINRQLDILEKQIALEITKAELNQVTELNKLYKQIKLNQDELALKNYNFNTILKKNYMVWSKR